MKLVMSPWKSKWLWFLDMLIQKALWKNFFWAYSCCWHSGFDSKEGNIFFVISTLLRYTKYSRAWIWWSKQHVRFQALNDCLEHFQQTLQIFVLFGEWTVTFSFYLSTFLNTLLTNSLSYSLSYLNIIYSFIVYSFFNNHLFIF